MRRYFGVWMTGAVAAVALGGCAKPCVNTVPAMLERQVVAPTGGGAWAISPSNDGGFIVAGFRVSQISSAGDALENPYLVKVADDLSVQWESVLSSNEDAHILGVQPTSDGGYVYAGLTGSSVIAGRVVTDLPRILVGKVDGLGNELFRRVVEEGLTSVAHSVQVNSDDSFIVAGESGEQALSHRSNTGIVIKFDNNGDEIWTRRYARGSASGIVSACLTPGGGYVLAGVADQAAYVFEVDADGVVLWEFLSSEEDGFEDLYIARSIIQTRDGGYALVCDVFNHEDRIAVLRLDSIGEPVWAARASVETFARGYDLAEAGNGDLVVVGEASPNAPPIDVRNCARSLVVHVDHSGRVRQTKLLGINSSSAAMAIAAEGSDNVVLAGYTLSNRSYTPRSVYLMVTGVGP